MFRMKQERIRRGWNQMELALNAGMTTQDVCRIETGRMRPYATQVERLAKVLGLETAALMIDDCPEASLPAGPRHRNSRA